MRVKIDLRFPLENETIGAKENVKNAKDQIQWRARNYTKKDWMEGTREDYLVEKKISLWCCLGDGSKEVLLWLKVMALASKIALLAKQSDRKCSSFVWCSEKSCSVEQALGILNVSPNGYCFISMPRMIWWSMYAWKMVGGFIGNVCFEYKPVVQKSEPLRITKGSGNVCGKFQSRLNLIKFWNEAIQSLMGIFPNHEYIVNVSLLKRVGLVGVVVI